MEMMTKPERVRAAIRGEAVDRVPVALWRHFPGDDQRPADLARATSAFQTRYDFDFVKVSPSNGFIGEDWGAVTIYRGNPEGTREYVERPVKRPADWHKLKPLDVRRGVLGQQLECLRLLEHEWGTTVPFIQTVFNPLMVARYLRGEAWVVDLREYPDDFRAGLEIITETMARLAHASVAAGAAGIFFATQAATYRLLSEAEYREFGVPYDLRVLAAAERGWFNLLHIHGDDIMFDLLHEYPVQAVNWHDRSTAPSLKEARGKFKGALVGGVKQWETLLQGNPAQVEAEVQEAIAQTGGRGLIVAAGCVIPITTPEANIQAVVKAARAGR